MNDDPAGIPSAALSCGFQACWPEGFMCTESQLIAFAMSCERAGTERVASILRGLVDRKLPAASVAGAVSAIADQLDKAIAAYDADVAAVIEAARSIRLDKEYAEARKARKRTRRSVPTPERPELTRLIADACAAFAKLTPEQQEAHRAEQRASWVRGESQLDRKPNPACGNDPVPVERCEGGQALTCAPCPLCGATMDDTCGRATA